MGRTKRIRSKADPESLALLKTIIRDYPKLKKSTEVYETMRKSILTYIKTGSGLEQLLNYERYYDLGLSDGDKTALQAYFDAKEKIYLLEEGMRTVPDGRRKEIAVDKMLYRMNNDSLMGKYSICYKTIKRATQEVSNYLGVFIDEYMEWKARELYL